MQGLGATTDGDLHAAARTIHPSAVPRSADREARGVAMRGLVDDLRRVAARLG